MDWQRGVFRCRIYRQVLGFSIKWQMRCWLVGLLYWGLTAKVISWRSVTHMCFLAFSHQYLHHFSFFPKPPTTFLTCFCRGERRKYAGKKSRLDQGSNPQPPGFESDTLTTEPPGRGANALWGTQSYKIKMDGSCLTLYSIDTHFDESTTDSFWKHREERRNCS